VDGFGFRARSGTPGAAMDVPGDVAGAALARSAGAAPPCREEIAVDVTAGFGWRGARLTGTPQSAGRQTIWRSQFVQGAVRAADQAWPRSARPYPALPSPFIRAGGSAGIGACNVSHAKPNSQAITSSGRLQLRDVGNSMPARPPWNP